MRHFIKEWGPLILLLLILTLSRTFIWQPVKVDGHSMDSTLANGECLVVLSAISIDRLDIAVTKETEDGKTGETVRRVIGMPSDTIVHKNDVLYVNGRKAGGDYLNEYKKAFENDQLQDTYSYNVSFQELVEGSDASTTDNDSNTGLAVRVLKRQCYLLGDGRITSRDSREVGISSKSDIAGKAKFRFRPLSEIDFIN